MTTRTVPLVLAAAAAAAALAGCGLITSSWDVRLEVTGSGRAEVLRKFSGELEQQNPARTVPLPWHEARSVGYGYNSVDVRGASPGATCRILVNGRVVQQRTADAAGRLRCEVSVQEDGEVAPA